MNGKGGYQKGDKTNFISCFDDLWIFNIGRNEFDVKKDDDGFLEF